MMFANTKTHAIGLGSGEHVSQASEKCIVRKHVRVYKQDPLFIHMLEGFIAGSGEANI